MTPISPSLTLPAALNVDPPDLQIKPQQVVDIEDSQLSVVNASAKAMPVIHDGNDVLACAASFLQSDRVVAGNLPPPVASPYDSALCVATLLGGWS
jgi:hypothetical protein